MPAFQLGSRASVILSAAGLDLTQLEPIEISRVPVGQDNSVSFGDEIGCIRSGGACLHHLDLNEDLLLDWIPQNIVSDTPTQRDPLTAPLGIDLPSSVWSSTGLDLSQSELDCLMDWADFTL